MKDKYGRIIDYVRISVTERCNFKCSYCMPNGCPDIDDSEFMSDEEILNLCTEFAKLGVKFIKLTGGEPLIRKGIIELIRSMKSIEGIEQVTVTTNGSTLDTHLEELIEVGIDGINISIDTLDREHFKRITGVDKLPSIIENIKRSQELGMKNIKLNCVLLKGENEAQCIEIAKFAKQYDICVKFIEMMPIGTGKEHETYTLEELEADLTTVFGESIPLSKKYGNGPAAYHTYEGFVGKIGLIGAVTHKFCDNCNRVRVTSKGFLKTCLQFSSGVDLNPHFFKPSLKDIIESTVYDKQKEHEFDKDEICFEEHKLMSEIGG